MAIQSFLAGASIALVAQVVLAVPAAGIARAELVASERVHGAIHEAAARDRIRAFVDREDVRAQLEALGVTPAEARARMDVLGQAEVARIDAHLASLPTGEGAVETVVVAMLNVFLVLLVTDLIGLTDVFPFVKASPGPRR